MGINVKRFIIDRFSNSDVLFTNSGRAGLQAIIEDFKLQDSKIIIPSFICSNVFSQLLIQNNMEPILVDSPKKSFNITFKDIKRAHGSCKNKKLIRSILILHTFGLVNKDIMKISKWCKQKNIILIEDCAHSLNISYNGRFVGTFGDTASLSIWKILQLPFGGCYIRNNGKIQVNTVPYKLNTLDIYKSLRFLPFGRMILDLLKLLKFKKKFKVDPSKIEITPPPFLFNYLSISNRKVDIEQRKKYTQFFYNELKKEIPKELFHLEFNNNFFHSIPLLVNNQNDVYVTLLNNKIVCGKMWDNPLSKDAQLNKKYKLNKTPNTNFYSKRIINILINDPKYNEKKIKQKAKIISEIVKRLR